MLLRQVERIRASRERFDLVVATTPSPGDDAVAELCREAGVACFRGHPTDLLDRHVQAARAHGADAVAKIPSDCPLIDPLVIDEVLGFFAAHAGDYDFVSNLHPATWPDGNDVEVMWCTALETAWREAERPLEREHTTPFLWEHPERFRIGNVAWKTGWNYSMSHRWTVDYPEDYELVRAVYEALWRPERPVFHVEDILALLTARPEIAALNARYAGVNWYRHHLGELRTVGAGDTRQIEEAR
jgi:spore coat polysaccharide biosynthesis protein SpsF